VSDVPASGVYSHAIPSYGLHNNLIRQSVLVGGCEKGPGGSLTLIPHGTGTPTHAPILDIWARLGR